MKYLLRMAFRNLNRNRVRSAVSVLAIAVAIAVVVFAKGLIGGMIDSVLDNTIRLTAGHVRIVQAAYPKKERLLPLTYPVDRLGGEDVEAFARRLSGLPGVAVATPRIRFAALVSHGDEPEGVLGMGLDFSKEEGAAHLSRYLAQGRFPHAGANEVVLGQRLLNKLGLRVGARVTLVANTSYGSLNGRTFTIVGSLMSGLAQLDESSVFLSLRSAQRLVDLDQAATEVIVMAKDPGRVPQISAEVSRLVKAGDPEGRYTVVPWYKASPLVGYMLAAGRLYDLVYVVIVLFASFVVINTMLMIVNERTREIGMLGAMGFTGSQLVTLLVLEGAALGLLGSTVGVAVGAVITNTLAKTGIDFGQATQALGKELLYPSRIYPIFDLHTVLYAFVLGVLVPAAGSFFPARRAQRLDPSTALRAL
ncbi:MAG TPA: ABC transporter permease [Firmicutes bacterium]|nr:ABC transporter permease [Bacillota bacterium]